MAGMCQALEKLRGVRHIEWVLIAVGLAAMMLVMGRSQEGTATEQTALERRMESILSSVEGAGEVRVLVNQAEAAFASSGAAVTGVLVVAEGADDVRVSIELQRAVQAVLGVEAARIEIMTMREDAS